MDKSTILRSAHNFSPRPLLTIFAHATEAVHLGIETFGKAINTKFDLLLGLPNRPTVSNICLNTKILRSLTTRCVEWLFWNLINYLFTPFKVDIHDERDMLNQLLLFYFHKSEITLCCHYNLTYCRCTCLRVQWCSTTGE